MATADDRLEKILQRANGAFILRKSTGFRNRHNP
jgi:hypothetical protein